MTSEDITSPPYPGEGTTAALLHPMLGELARWIDRGRPAINASAGREVVPRPPSLPPLAAFRGLPVAAQFRTLMCLRKTRECWDDLVRRYEAEWDSPACLRAQASLMILAATQLESCCRPFEVREAELQRRSELEGMNRTFERLASTLFDLWEPGDGPDVPGTAARA